MEPTGHRREYLLQDTVTPLDTWLPQWSPPLNGGNTRMIEQTEGGYADPPQCSLP